MIKANELRIGNLIIDEFGDHRKVIALGKNSVTFEYDIIDEYNNLKPIPLTEERLLKFGFICDEMDDISRPYYLKNGMSILYDDLTVISWKGCDLELEFLDGKIYVHQLQNLYFALTGEDLIPESPNP